MMNDSAYQAQASEKMLKLPGKPFLFLAQTYFDNQMELLFNIVWILKNTQMCVIKNK